MFALEIAGVFLFCFSSEFVEHFRRVVPCATVVSDGYASCFVVVHFFDFVLQKCQTYSSRITGHHVGSRAMRVSVGGNANHVSVLFTQRDAEIVFAHFISDGLHSSQFLFALEGFGNLLF